MKNLKFLILSIFAFSLVFSCRSEEKDYNGDKALIFSTATEISTLVNQGESKVIKIYYGTLANVDSDHTVKLVLDQEMSDTFDSGALEILNDGISVISSGTPGNYFEVKLTGDFLSTDPKKAVFKLQSETLSNANYNQMFTLTASRVCPITNFVGMFNNDVAWWYEGNSYNFEIVEGDEPNSIVIKDFFGEGRHFDLVYNPDTFAVTTPNPNDSNYLGVYTGYDYQNNPNQKAYALVKPASGSTLNPCTRVLDLNVYYYVPGVGSFGTNNEHFVGN